MNSDYDAFLTYKLLYDLWKEYRETHPKPSSQEALSTENISSREKVQRMIRRVGSLMVTLGHKLEKVGYIPTTSVQTK